MSVKMSDKDKVNLLEEEVPSVDDEGVTFEVEEGAQFVVNEETGEFQVIDLGDPNISQEVEVVTVEATASTQVLQTTRKPTNKLETSATTSHNLQNIGHRVKSGPALLRNSRRFQIQAVDPLQCSAPETNVTLRGRQITQGASQLPPASSAAKYLNKSGRQSTQSTSQNVVSMNSVNQGLLQHAFVLDENGQATQEYVVLAPSESGEYSIVNQGISDQQQYFDPSDTDMEKMDNAISIQHEGQTIIICQDPGSNQVSHVIEDEDGNFIPVDTSNLEYQMEDGTIFSINEGDVSGFDTSSGITVSDTLRQAKPKRKFKKPLQVIIGPDGQPLKKKGQTELKCMEKGCIMTSFNVAELRKHLNVSHAIMFDEEVINFTDDKEFKRWRETYERERMVSFIYRGGTKKIAKDQAVTYMICHRSGHYKPTMTNESQRKRKMKPQGSCKMGGYCTAGIKLLKNLDTGAIKMDICHTHYGHPLDSDAIPHLRVNPTLRKIILGKFKEGLTFTQVLAYIHHNPDRLEGLRLIDRRAVRNIFDTWKHPTRRSKQAQKDIDELPINEGTNNSTTTSRKQDKSKSQEEPIYLIPNSPSSVVDENSSTVRMEEDCSALNIEENTAAHVEEENSSESLQGIPSLLPIAQERSVTTDNVEDSGPPKLVLAVEKQKKDNKAPKKRHSSSETDDEEKECFPIRKIKSEHGAEIIVTRGAYGLRPNRKVEVYKPIKAKRSRISQDLDPEPEVKKTTLRKSKRVSVEKVKPKTVTKKTSSTSEPAAPMREEPPPIIISQLLEQAIDKLINHGESGPTVLLYKPIGNIVKYGEAKSATRKDLNLRKDEFCVVLQTPVQRQLLQMFPSVIGFEILDGPKSSENQLKLAFLIVLDEYREAIPVAWLVANSVEPRIIGNFFKAVRNECGELRTKYFMSPRNSEAHKLWCSAFEEKPLSVQNDIEVKRDLKNLVWQEFSTDKGRREVWDLLESLIVERESEHLTLSHLEDKFEPLLDKLPHSGLFLEKLNKEWLSKSEEWAMSYRFGGVVNLVGVSNSFGKLKKFVSFKGTKHLNESFEHILKIGYDKCFLRSKRMFKGDQKHSQFLEDIRTRHTQSRVISQNVSIESTSEDTWVLSVSGNKSCIVSFVNSPCSCKLLCKHCKICVHMYLCTCKDYISTQIMCEHIHYTHCNRNNIQDEPELITGDINPSDEHNAGVFGKFETNGTEENPSQIINIDAVLKAAGLFHRSDGLQPDQIVSITDADTHRIIYEHNPSDQNLKSESTSESVVIIEPAETEIQECSSANPNE